MVARHRNSLSGLYQILLATFYLLMPDIVTACTENPPLSQSLLLNLEMPFIVAAVAISFAFLKQKYVHGAIGAIFLIAFFVWQITRSVEAAYC